ncbi:cenp-B [Aspergillus flavus]|nr:cenp-B [Aspergillus flavus]
MQRRPISNSQKLALRSQHALKPYLTQLQLCQWFEAEYQQPIAESSVSRILSSRYDSLDGASSHQLRAKRRRAESWPELERALYEWIRRVQDQESLSQHLILQKARTFWERLYPGQAMPQFSNGWMRGFQSRWDINKSNLQGKSASHSDDGTVELIGIRQLLNQYAPRDIFACDETALLWKRIPESGLAAAGHTPTGTNGNDRLTTCFCCNSDASERLPLWFVGTAKRPQAFSAAGINIENLGCHWRFNTRAWMTSTIFTEWLLWFDQRMTGRKVVLLMDGLSAHKFAFEEVGSQLQNTFIIWIPATPEEKYQPLSQGILFTWKSYWKCKWASYLVHEHDRGWDPISTMKILHAIRWAISIWEIDLADDIFTHAFRATMSIESIERIDNRQTIMDIENLLHQLYLSGYVSEPMDTSHFIDPVEEKVDDSTLHLDDSILCHFENASELQESASTAIQPLSLVSVSDALEGLYKLRLYEEQQVIANMDLLQVLKHHEKLLLQKQTESQRVSDARAFF